MILLHQLIQRDKTNSVILDVDVLSALPTGLVRGIYIDCLYKLSQSIRIKFFNIHIFVCGLNELLNILVLSFLYLNFLTQGNNLGFKLFLLGFIALTHHVKTFVAQLALGVILVDFDEQPFQFRDTLLVAFQLPSADLDFLCGLHTHLLSHNGYEMLSVVEDISGYQLDMAQHHAVKNSFPDEVCAAFVLTLPVQRTVEESSLSLAVVGSTVIQLLTAVRAEYQTGKHTCSTRLGFAMTLLTDLLNLFKDFFCDNRFMGIIKDCLIFYIVQSLLLIPDRIGVGLEIDDTAGVLSAFQNLYNGIATPSARFIRCRIRRVDALASLVCRRSENLLLPQHIGNLRRASPLHTQVKDIFHNLGCFRINDPMIQCFGFSGSFT